ncbi:hypothetical protein IG631_18542 [Alternaria alternata]|nr:hypothetical protein IG631_18542 [Alternaria alternata]
MKLACQTRKTGQVPIRHLLCDGHLGSRWVRFDCSLSWQACRRHIFGLHRVDSRWDTQVPDTQAPGYPRKTRSTPLRSVGTELVHCGFGEARGMCCSGSIRGLLAIYPPAHGERPVEPCEWGFGECYLEARLVKLR